MVIIRNLSAGNRDETVRVAILDDHRLISASVSAALHAEGFHVVVPDLADPGGVESRLRHEPPAVALLDLDLGAFGRGEDGSRTGWSCGSRTAARGYRKGSG